MNSTDLTTTSPATEQAITINRPDLHQWAQNLADAHQIGSALCTTSFAPTHFRGKPDEAAAAILYGSEVGFTPTQALQNLYVIGGKPALYARPMVAIVQAAGHEVWTVEKTDESVTVAGRRRGSEHTISETWTVDRAKRAGYTNNKKYQTDPQAMLYARAASDVCRQIAADALAGMAYSVEELELTVVESTPIPARRGLDAVRAAVAQPEPEPDEAPEPTTTRRAGVRPGGVDGTDRMSARTRGRIFAQMSELWPGADDDQQRQLFAWALGVESIASRKDITEEQGLRIEERFEAEKTRRETATEQDAQEGVVTDMDHGEERRMDAEFDAHQDRIADDQDTRDRLGFDIGDHVTVGNGKTEWVIQSFSTAAATGEALAHLEPVLGYSGTTVTVDRLRAVT